MRAATAGPDPFGYTWCDSDEPGNNADVPAFFPEDLRALGFRGDDTVIPIDLPVSAFPTGFPYYGAKYSRFWLSSNGWLSFVDPAGLSAPLSTLMPAPPAPNALVAFFWSDLTLETTTPRAEGGLNVGNDGYTLSLNVTPFSKPGPEADLFVTLYSDGCIKMVWRGDIVAIKATAEIAIEDAPGRAGLPYLEAGAALGGANFRADYAVYFSFGSSCCGQGCVAEVQPPALGNVLLAVRSASDAVFSWSPPPFSGRGFRVYLDGDPRLPFASRALVAETPLAQSSTRDQGALAHSPLPLGFYQVVGVSCFGTLESPY